MKRFFIRLILSLCFLLVKGNDHLHASMQQNMPGFNSVETLSDIPSFLQTTSYKQHHAKASFKAAHPVKKKENESKSEELEDEEELTSSKKHFEFCNFCVALVYTLTPGFTALNQFDRLPFCEHFSYSSSFKYLLHCVFRI